MSLLWSPQHWEQIIGPGLKVQQPQAGASERVPGARQNAQTRYSLPGKVERLSTVHGDSGCRPSP